MFYFVKTPRWLQILYGDCIWKMPTDQKKIYLTFDDGPHESATPFVLEQLKEYGAKATFFCIGKNVVEQPLLYEQIVSAGHAVGNHTFNHLNGWQTSDSVYLDDISKTKKYVDSTLFRPPYGRASRFQIKLLSSSDYRLKTIMWTVLSGDFDEAITEEKCLRNVLKNAGSGSIVVFHDSNKAYAKLVFALPKVLAYFTGRGYRFEKIMI